MSAGAVRAGGVFVEIGADPRKFFSALSKVNKSLASMGGSLVSGGGRLAAAGIGMAAPIVAAVRQGQQFESTLLNIRASTGATAAEINKIRDASMQMSQALGVGPTEAAGGMLELLKAGMSLETVLAGAGKTAMEFAKVGEMDVSAAAVVMSDAMNVFKVSADVAANALSSAADASSTSIAQMSEAFSMSSAVAGLAGMSIQDLSGALAILANNGVKGSDAGTSVKTMLMRLMAPADDAVGALKQLGLTVGSFRGADGQMLPMVEIIRLLNDEMQGLDQTAKDDIFRRLFGADAIRAASILASAGVEGFQSMQDAMASALPVGEKYKILMSGLAGAGGSILAAMQRLAISISDAVAPALAGVVPFITGFIDGLTKLATDNKELVAGFAKFVAASIAVGGAMTALGVSLTATSFALSLVGKAAMLSLSPLAVFSGAVVGIGKRLTAAIAGPITFAASVGSSMLSASASVVSFAATSTSAMAGFATSSATAMAGFAASSVAGFVRVSGAASAAAQAMFPVFFTGFNRGIAAGAGFFSATLRGLNGVAMASSALRGAMFAVSGSGMARFASDIAGGLAFTYKSFVWWASGTSARLAQYIVNAYAAVAASVASTAKIGAAWVTSGIAGVAAFVASATGGISTYIASAVVAAAASVTNAVRSGAAWAASALPGVMAFVGGAVAGIGAYLGAAAMAVAGSVASAAAVAAAWLAPLAPFALLAAAIGGAGVLAYSFGGQIRSALGSVGEMAGQAGSAIATTLGSAVADGIVVFGDLYSTATTTFHGIYDAIAAGDLSGAMDVLWAGLNAGWLRGVEALMSYVDPWIATFQNVFTIMGAEIYKGWDALWVSVGSALNTAGAYLMGAFDNIINPILAMWDTLEAGILKSWNYIQSFFKKGFDLKKENEKVDNKMDARRRKRELERPGIEKRVAAAGKENVRAEGDMIRRRDAVDANTQETIAGRDAANQQRAADRRAATVAAEGALTSLVSGKTETRARNSQVDDLLASIKGATSVDQLAGVGGLGDQFSTLRDLGRLTSDQETMLSDALDKAAEKLTGTATAAQAGADAAGAQSVQSMGAVAGTFSSLNLGSVFGGSSLAERTAKAAEETAKNTRKIDGFGKVSA